MEAKPGGSALLSFDDPVRFLKDAEDVRSFHLFQGIGYWQQWGGVPLKRHIVDLKYWSLREDRGPFDDIFQLPNVTRPGIFHEAFHSRLRHAVDLLADLA